LASRNVLSPVPFNPDYGYKPVPSDDL